MTWLRVNGYGLGRGSWSWFLWSPLRGTDASTFNAVVIYCAPFHVIFSVAPLQ